MGHPGAALTPEGITRTDVGKYYYDLGPALTANRGLLTMQWVYEVNGQLASSSTICRFWGRCRSHDSLSDQGSARGGAGQLDVR